MIQTFPRLFPLCCLSNYYLITKLLFIGNLCQKNNECKQKNLLFVLKNFLWKTKTKNKEKEEVYYKYRNELIYLFLLYGRILKFSFFFLHFQQHSIIILHAKWKFLVLISFLSHWILFHGKCSQSRLVGNKWKSWKFYR